MHGLVKWSSVVAKPENILLRARKTQIYDLITSCTIRPVGLA